MSGSTTLLFANNASSTLATALVASATSAQLSPGTGVLFPQPTSGQAFYGTLTDAATETLIEIVLVTVVAGDSLTIARAQQGTTAQNWNIGDYFARNITAGDLQNFYQPPYPISNFSAFMSNWLEGLPTLSPSNNVGWWSNGGVPTLAGPIVAALDPFSVYMSNWMLSLPTTSPVGGGWWSNGGVPTLAAAS